jgi:hypothetical protein
MVLQVMSFLIIFPIKSFAAPIDSTGKLRTVYSFHMATVVSLLVLAVQFGLAYPALKGIWVADGHIVSGSQGQI